MKLVLHGAKYPSRAVCGLLVSRADASNTALRITDVLPLFHITPLAPSLELALAQAEAVLAQRGTGILSGVYFSTELYDGARSSSADAQLPTTHAHLLTRIADKLRENGAARSCSGARILLLDPLKLGEIGAPDSAALHSALDVFERSASGKWAHTGAADIAAATGSQAKDGSSEAVSSVIEQLRLLLAGDKQRALSDFDDHLDDAKADWTNVSFDKQVLPTMANE
jgi:hypothetical protein